MTDFFLGFLRGLSLSKRSYGSAAAMSASQLEQMRLLHEELEALENHAVEVLEARPDAVSSPVPCL